MSFQQLLLAPRGRNTNPTTITINPGTTSVTLPADFNWKDFKVRVWADGGSGAAAGATNYANSGGGGAYSEEVGINLPGWLPGVTIPCFVGPGGAQVSDAGAGVVGNPGQGSWIGIGATNLANSQVGAEGGFGGNVGLPPAIALGGRASQGKGSVKFSGGASPSAGPPYGAGGAAGPDGNGQDGTLAKGGNGDNGSGGTGGNSTNALAVAFNGASNALGGGGGGACYTASGTTLGGNGGTPGGGSGSGSSSGGSLGTSGVPGAGKIEIIYN